MLESYPLVTTVVASIALAFLFGLLANRLYLPTILGYLISGIILGPNTPGFVANINMAEQLAEIGVILLMFGVGLHFSIDDLKRVHRIAIPGAIIQMFLATILCFAVAIFLNYDLGESLVLGITISVASTVVLIRTLEQNRMLDSYVGKVGIGWLLVEDIAMIVVLVLVPVFFKIASHNQNLNFQNIMEMIFLVLIKIAAFVVVMIVFGKKLLPGLLVAIAKTKSRELMTLGTVAISSGFAFVAYTVFGASFALGAFMAGFVLNESVIGRKYAEKSLPLRDIFSVLFFVATGMLFNPRIIIEEPALVILTLIIVIFGKMLISYFIMRVFRQNHHDSMILAFSLAQIGEFSFILSALALKLKLFLPSTYDMVIASAIISIVINPFLFKLVRHINR